MRLQPTNLAELILASKRLIYYPIEINNFCPFSYVLYSIVNIAYSDVFIVTD